METIGSRARAEREKQGITRAEMAKSAGIAMSTLSDLELGRSKSTTALHKIAKRLGVRVEWLETGKGSDHPPPSQVSRPDFEMMAAAVSVLSHYLELVGDPPEWVHDPVLLEIAYMVAEEFGRPVAPENVLDLTKVLSKRIRGVNDERQQGSVRGTRAASGG